MVKHTKEVLKEKEKYLIQQQVSKKSEVILGNKEDINNAVEYSKKSFRKLVIETTAYKEQE